MATRSDIAPLEGMIEALGSELRAEIKEIRTILLQQQRTYMATTVGAMTALTAIFGVIVAIVV